MVEAVFANDCVRAEALAGARLPDAWPGKALVERAFSADLELIREDPDGRLWGDRLMIGTSTIASRASSAASSRWTPRSAPASWRSCWRSWNQSRCRFISSMRRASPSRSSSAPFLELDDAAPEGSPHHGLAAGSGVRLDRPCATFRARGKGCALWPACATAAAPPTPSRRPPAAASGPRAPERGSAYACA